MGPELSKRKFSIAAWYRRFEPPISSLSLIGGFVFDALTLKRVDMFWENFWVVAHLLIVATCIILINLSENTRPGGSDPARTHFWLVNVLQFFFGGLLSTFLVFYFRSGTLAASWPFFLILAAAFFANESFKRHYERLSFQISLFFLSLYSFAIFLVPVVLRKIGPDAFLISGFLSLSFLCVYLIILKYLARETFRSTKKILLLSISGIFLAMNGLYFFNFIPPIPLSLKDAGIYHSLVRNADGNYTVQGEDHGPFGFFNLYEDVHLVPGSPVYAYSAIFSPAAFSTNIVHEWQWYDENAHAWTTASRIELPLAGGREGGYRTYSVKTGLAPGYWRVNVLTTRGEVIGRLRFNVILGYAEPAVRTDVKD